mgnify:FL=1
MLTENYTDIVWQSIFESWDKPAVANYKSDTYLYSEVAQYIYRFDQLFEKCGIKKGDKISLIGKNAAEWCIAYQSIVLRGSVVVPILPNFTPSDVQHLINHSDSTALFVNNNHWETLNIESMPNLKIVISLDDFSILYLKDKKFYFYVNEFKTGLLQKLEKDEILTKRAENHDLFAIIYTSGTTGFSKGVMLTHNNMMGNLVFIRTYLPLKNGSKILSFLPLAHAYGCMVEFIYPFSIGAHITLLGKMPSPEILLKAFGEVRPHLIVFVPLILEKIYKKKIKPLLDKKGVKILNNIPFVNRLIFKKIKDKLMENFGGNFYQIIIGGAALNEEVQQVLHKAGFPITVGYGMTECVPLISYSDWKDFRLYSAGQKVGFMEMRIDSEDAENVVGEILVRGENVMSGYYKNQEATDNVLDSEGWLHTGDMGTIDKDGYLFIKGRCKSMILSSNGQNIYPEEIESKLNTYKLVQESIVVERKEGLVAIVYPDMALVDKKNIKEKTVLHIFDHYLDQLNKELPNYMKVAKIELVAHEFEKTPKRSIKRFLYN